MKFSSASRHVVLLVDDNKDGLLVRRALLEEQGYDVHTAPDGQQGLKLFRTLTFNVVVTDYRMPVMSGLELIREIREAKPDTPIVLLSGLVEPLGLTQENTGADAVIAKNNNEAAHLVRWVRRLANRTPSRKPPLSQRRSLARVRA
jgi:CheY-like chemotaxis protein